MRPATRSEPPAVLTTVLVVDDAAEIRHFCRNILETEGYQVLEAADGADAMLLAQTPGCPIDLVITDVIMPRLNGVALVEQLAKIRPQTPVLVMSGYLEASLLGQKIPQMVLLHKPFTPECLVAAISRARAFQYTRRIES